MWREVHRGGRMPRMSEEIKDRFLQLPIPGIIATLRSNGLPYTVPIWWLHIDGEFWITGTHSRIWCKQLKKDPRASLCIENGGDLPGHMGVDGTVELYELPSFDIWPISRQLAEEYVGRGDPSRDADVEAFFSNMQTEPRLLFKLIPTVWRAIDMSVYEGKKADRDFQAEKKLS